MANAQAQFAGLLLEVKTAARNGLLDLIDEKGGLLIYDTWLSMDRVTELFGSMRVVFTKDSVSIEKSAIPFVLGDKTEMILGLFETYISESVKASVRSAIKGGGIELAPLSIFTDAESA